MLFTITRASHLLPFEGARQETIDGCEQFVVELSSLDDLLCLVDQVASECIVRRGYLGNATIPHITIYDDYLE